ncbi:ABC transporter substrate-binding protein [Frankia tisae]|uniref:ABC transporter substrate-binding protein n=1 Tax=Frankia tisae TaxID=2950104 RepID=UPI0021BE9166|nr:ABC transporter substrate-binding protein [Frankia tisae]
MNSISRWRRFAGALAALALTAIAGCGGGGATATGSSGSSQQPHRGGNVIFLENGDFGGFAQQDLRLWQTSSVAVNLFDRLVYVDPGSGKVEPWLATSWSVDPTFTRIELTLRTDVTFSDGSRLTPEVVKNNLDRFGVGDPKRGITPSRPQFAAFDRAEVVGNDKVRIYLSRPDTGFLNNLGDLRHSIVAQSALDLGYEEASKLTNAIGSGPFVFDSEKPGTQIKIVRRAGYKWPPGSADHTGEAYLDSITYIISSEGASRTGLLLSGQAQAARDILITDEKKLQERGFHYFGARPFGGVRDLEINPFANKIIADVRVRQAILHGIDQDELIKTVYNDNWTKALGLVQSKTPGFVDSTAEYHFDAAEANRLLDEAGWTGRDRDGIRLKDGQRLSFKVYPESQWVVPIPDVELIAIQLARIGIKFDIVKVDRATYTAQVAKPDNPFSWGHTTATDVNQLWNRYRSGGAGGLNDPEFDKLLDTVNKIQVGPKRTAAVAAVQKYLLDNALIVPLQETQQSFVTAPKLQGFKPETLGRSYFYDAWLE